ncbi:MAG: AMP-binding protein [Paludibacter sp.]|nr:AMP-binding protein [Paludibacter sp.]
MYRKIELRSLTLRELIDNSVSKFTSYPAVSFVNGNSLTYGELGKKVDEVSLLYYSIGLKPGDKIALFSQNMPNWVIAYFAAVAKGLVIVPILPDFTRQEVENVLLHSECKVLVVSNKLRPRVEELELPALEAKILVNDFSLISGEITQKLTLSEVNSYLVKEEDVAAIIYTSGTTGRPKGVVLTQKNITFVASKSFSIFPIDHSDVFLSFLPLSHTYENSIGMLYPIMYGASINFLEKPPTASSLIPAMATIRPTMMLSVPLIMEKLYKSQVKSKFSKSPLSRAIYKTSFFRILIHHIAGKKLKETFGGRLKFFGIGGAKLDARVERFLKEAGFPYAIGYGLTETAPLIAGAAPHQTKLQSTGFPLEGVTVKIDNPDKKGVGEIWAKGPNVMREYYKNQNATFDVLTQDGWFKTGDYGKLDKKNRLYIKGRLKNMILGASGENIYPEDIESIINNNQYVSESLVIEEDGFLVAKVILDIESLEKNIEHIKTIVEEKTEKYYEWRSNFTKELNLKLNKVSQLKRVDIMEVPFEKTASQKIKRFLYTKPIRVK